MKRVAEADGKAAHLPVHLEEIARALRKQADASKPKPPLSYQADIVVRREVTKLARLAGVRRLVSHSATFARAVTELQARESLRASQQRAFDSGVTILARWLDLTHLMPKPEPKQKKKLPPLKRRKAIRRFKLNGNWLEDYGVEMGDRLLVAMTGAVLPGEVGYFRITRTGSDNDYYHNAFHLLHEVDKTCIEWARSRGTICLRNYGNRCMGNHDGDGREVSAYGRVCAVERDRQPVATTLPLRPYDEREGGPTTSLDSEPEVETKAALRARTNQPSAAETKQKLDDLRRRLDYVRNDILGCTERMKLEKQIYDLEHPIGGDWNDWSEWEEEYDAWKEDVRRAIKGTRNPE